MSKRILITGGAGFIGSHLTDELLAHGYRVRILDSLCPQVHGPGGNLPDYFNPDAELLVGDVRDPEAVRQALKDVEAVFHLAAAVGVGQSMYEIAHYTEVNNVGTAVLLEALSRHTVERLIVASSMSLYGEGLYRAADGSLVGNAQRTLAQLRAHQWELLDAHGQTLTPLPTPETKAPALASVYALSKYDQESMALIVAGAYGISASALRFFNVYGTRQALGNPYTGVLAIFASRYLNGRPPLVCEDGRQLRDFVNVRDVARACRLALEAPHAGGQVFNIGSGQRYTVKEIAERMAAVLGHAHLAPQITHQYRSGDIRHCFADISHARAVLGYKPQVSLEDGLTEVADWLAHQLAVDRVAEAGAELRVAA